MEMDISPTQRVEAGPEWTGCEEKIHLRTPLVVAGQCGTQARLYLMVFLVSSYPLKPHGCSTSSREVPLVC
jgi:hypothetical protein